MNTLKNILIITTAFAVLTSCNLLDSQTPQQNVAADQAFATTQALEAALIGAYGDMQGGANMGADYLIHSETMADNAQFIGSFTTFQDIAARDIAIDNGTVENMWSEGYELINDVNLIIEAVDAGEIDEQRFEQIKDRVKGEALAMRGLMLFEMVRLWALPWGTTADNSHIGIPIVTEGAVAIDDFNDQRTRSTVAEVYAQAKADLQQAIDLLSGEGIINDGRLNELSVSAYLARVNLQQGNYQEVADLTDAVISSNQYSLEGSPVAFFENEEASSEAVFDILHNEQDNPGVNASLPTFYAPSFLQGREDIIVTDDYLAAVAADVPQFQRDRLPDGGEIQDVRVTELTVESSSGISSLKYPDGANTADNAPVIRYPDVLLMNAEAKARLAADVASVPDEVIDNVNSIRLRSMQALNAEGQNIDTAPIVAYEKDDFNSKQELINAILLERRVELAFEGQRKHDLVRLGQPINGDDPTANNVIWPIPQEELNVNNEIQQNPGYGSN